MEDMQSLSCLPCDLDGGQQLRNADRIQQVAQSFPFRFLRGHKKLAAGQGSRFIDVRDIRMDKSCGGRRFAEEELRIIVPRRKNFDPTRSTAIYPAGLIRFGVNTGVDEVFEAVSSHHFPLYEPP